MSATKTPRKSATKTTTRKPAIKTPQVSNEETASTIGTTPLGAKTAKTIDAAVESAAERTPKAAKTPKEPKPAKEPKPVKTAEEALAEAKATDGAKWSKVVRVAEMGKSGPTRVVISCQSPQTKRVNGEDVSVCQGEREIAVQDLFQVTCCAGCQQRIVRKARRSKQRLRDKAMREQIKTARAK